MKLLLDRRRWARPMRVFLATIVLELLALIAARAQPTPEVAITQDIHVSLSLVIGIAGAAISFGGLVAAIANQGRLIREMRSDVRVLQDASSGTVRRDECARLHQETVSKLVSDMAAMDSRLSKTADDLFGRMKDCADALILKALKEERRTRKEE